MCFLNCVSCQTQLFFHIDADPNGDMSPVCARCVAEQDHDFDEEPHAEFDRHGNRVMSLEEARQTVAKSSRTSLKELRDRLRGIDDISGFVKGAKNP